MTTDVAMEYTDDMREISGFGGSYESACRRMALAGARHLIEHVSDETIAAWKGDASGAYKDSPAYLAFERAVETPDCTGAMHGAACGHAWHIRQMGWAAYKAKMIELRAQESDT